MVRTSGALAIAIIFLAPSLACTGPTEPPAASLFDAVVTPDGLVRDPDSLMDRAWLADNVDLSSYDQLLLVWTGLEYAPGSAILSERQREALSRVADYIVTKKLDENTRWSRTSELGPRVLVLRVAFVDIDLDPIAVRGFEPGRATYRADMGSLTVVVELRRGEDLEVLARLAGSHRIAVPAPGLAFSFDRGARTTDGRYFFSRWCDTALEELTRLSSAPRSASAP